MYRKCTSDEYYTTKEEVEYIFTQIIDIEQLSDKIVYCPCDSEESEFTKWLNDHKEEYQLKEFIHTSDDYNTHEDLFKRADIIITNPPFSSKALRPLLLLLKKYDKKFFLLLSLTTLRDYYKWLEHDYFNEIIFLPRTSFSFITPNNEYKNIGQAIYSSNMKLNYKDNIIYNNMQSNNIILNGVFEGNTYKAVDRIKMIPYDEEYFFVPTTFVVTSLYKEQFKTLNITSNIYYNDGKGRFNRLLVRRKPEYVGKKFNI